MTKLQGLLTEKNDVKVFILYLLSEIGYSLSYEEIHDVVIQNDYVGVYDFAECFAELLEAGHITGMTEDGATRYAVSPLGRRVAEELKTEIRPAIRERSLRSAVRMLSFRRMGTRLECRSEIRSDGKYDFHCAIIGKEGDLLRVTIAVDSLQLCEKMELHFREHPEAVFRGILALASGDVNFIV